MIKIQRRTSSRFDKGVKLGDDERRRWNEGDSVDGGRGGIGDSAEIDGPSWDQVRGGEFARCNADFLESSNVDKDANSEEARIPTTTTMTTTRHPTQRDGCGAI